MENIIVNLRGKARREKLLGRDYLVAPMTLIVPGVLNGSRGPLYYPPEEVGRYPENWDHKPITLNHPAGGARDPKTLQNTQLGFLLNARVEGGSLVAEGWFDIYRIMQLDKRILENLINGVPFELSTGLGVDIDETQGEFKGNRYIGVTRNYRPDHLAILMDARGACSLKDGCGVFNADSSGDAAKDQYIGLVGKSDKHFHTFSVDKDGNGYTNFVEGHQHRIEGYKVQPPIFPAEDNHTHSLDKNRILVDTGIKNDLPNRKEPTMASEKLVAELISNCSCFTDDDKETLLNMTEEKVQALVNSAKEKKQLEKVANAAKTGYESEDFKLTYNEEKGEFEVEAKKPKETTPPAATPPLTKEMLLNQMKELSPEEWFDAAPPAIQNQAREYDRVTNEEKDRLVNQLVSNVAETDKERLTNYWKTKPLEDLRMAVASLPVTTGGSNPYRPSYSGSNPAPPVTNQTPTPTPIPDPDWSFSS